MSPTDGRDELRGRFTRWIVITAKNAQKNYLRAEKKQLQTVPLEEADVAIVVPSRFMRKIVCRQKSLKIISTTVTKTDKSRSSCSA